MKSVAMICGISTPIGIAIARNFSEAGYCVCGSDPAPSSETFQIAGSCGGTVVGHEPRAAVEEVGRKLGRLDVLVCAAPLERADPLKAAFQAVSAVEPLFKKAKGGKIVVIASSDPAQDARLRAFRGALLGFARACARELGRYNVNVNAVAPELMLVEPVDVAHVALFLCSEDARHITGETIYLDGGIAA